MSNVIGTFMNAWLRPWATMGDVKAQGENAGIKSSILFVVAMGIISGIITAVAGVFVPPAAAAGAAVPKWFTWLAVVVVPALSFIGSFIGAFILWGLVYGLLKGTLPQYKTSYRLLAVLAAFSPVSALLSPIPKVGQYLAIAVNLWALIVMIRGIIIVMDTRPVRTWLMCLILFGALFVLGIAARFAAQRGGFPGAGPGLTDLGDEGDLDEDLGLGTDEELDKELKELAEQAKEGAKKGDTKR